MVLIWYFYDPSFIIELEWLRCQDKNDSNFKSILNSFKCSFIEVPQGYSVLSATEAKEIFSEISLYIYIIISVILGRNEI